MTDVATWVTGGIAALAAAVSVIFAWRADRSQRAAAAAQGEATKAARHAAEAADRAQRIQVRPTLRLEWDQRPAEDADNVPIVLSLLARNVGHGTAVIERVRLFEYGNLRVEFQDTRGLKLQIAEQFDLEIFQRLEGVRLESIPARLEIPALTEADRALEVGATRALFALIVDPAHAARICGKFRHHTTAQVSYRSLAGEEFETDQQFSDVRTQREGMA
jgi:hypothetical protein